MKETPFVKKSLMMKENLTRYVKTLVKKAPKLGAEDNVLLVALGDERVVREFKRRLGVKKVYVVCEQDDTTVYYDDSCEVVGVLKGSVIEFYRTDVDFNNMKFDCVIANPPYEGTLHWEFDNFVLKNCVKDEGYVVSLSPVGTLTVCSCRELAEAAGKGVMYEVFQNEKYVKEVDIVHAHESNNVFCINVESELGIKVYHKKPIYKGGWQRVLENARGDILPVYNKVVRNVLNNKGTSLKDNYTKVSYKEVIVKDKKEQHAVIDKPYIKVTGAYGGVQYRDDGTPNYGWTSIIPRDLEGTQNKRKPTEAAGGFLVFDDEETREKMLWRLLGKDCWLMRACSKTVKNDRHLKSKYILFIDPNDPRTDDEIAMQDHGMTAEEVENAKKWLNPYISQYDYPRPL